MSRGAEEMIGTTSLPVDFDDPEGERISEDSDLGGSGSGFDEAPAAPVSPPRAESRSRSPESSLVSPGIPGVRQYGRRRVAPHAGPVDALDPRGHTLVMTGPIIWCARCGRYVAPRAGRALRAQCVGAATGAYATRLAKLRQSRHPLTGAALMPG